MVNFNISKFFASQYLGYSVDYNLFFTKFFILVPKVASALSNQAFQLIPLSLDSDISTEVYVCLIFYFHLAVGCSIFYIKFVDFGFI